MKRKMLNRRDVLAVSFGTAAAAATAAVAMLPGVRAEAAERAADSTESMATPTNATRTFTKTATSNDKSILSV